MARCNAKVSSISIATFASCANQNKQVRSNGELCICVVPPNHQKQFQIRVITKLPNSEQSYKRKVITHKYINRQNQSTTGKL